MQQLNAYKRANLLRQYLAVVDGQDFDLLRLFQSIFVHTHNYLCRCGREMEKPHEAEVLQLSRGQIPAPLSILACLRAALSSIRSLGMPDSTALAMPPIFSTCFAKVDLMIWKWNQPNSYSYFFDNFQSRVVYVIGEGLHHVRATPRISYVSDSRLFLQNNLCVTGNSSRGSCRQP